MAGGKAKRPGRFGSGWRTVTFPSEEILEQLRRRYPEGTRIKLIRMDDPYNKKLGPGSKGTVRFVDAAGTL